MMFGLMALAGFVLLIICGNIAGMVLARNVTRDREIAVRLALGSSRARLVRHLLVEAFLLAALGGGAGILLAFWALQLATAANISRPGARMRGGSRGARSGPPGGP